MENSKTAPKGAVLLNHRTCGVDKKFVIADDSLYTVPMNTSGKVILIFIALSLLFVTGFKYKQYLLDEDFLFIAFLPCDPVAESCFVTPCDGECDTSSGIMFSDATPYKKIKLPAATAPQCLRDMTCLDFACASDDQNCETIYCSDDTINVDTVDGGEECVATGMPAQS